MIYPSLLLGSSGGIAPLCCFKRGQSAGEEGKNIQECLCRRTRISYIQRKSYNNNNNNDYNVPPPGLTLILSLPWPPQCLCT